MTLAFCPQRAVAVCKGERGIKVVQTSGGPARNKSNDVSGVCPPNGKDLIPVN